MKRIVVVFLLLAGSWNADIVFAQKQGQALIDSLLLELPKAKEDTNKVNLLNKISLTCPTINAGEGIMQGKKALMLSEKLGWKTGIANALNSIGSNYSFRRTNDTALLFCNRALSLSRELNDRKTESESLYNIGLIYQHLSDYPRALKYYEDALSTGKQSGNKQVITYSLSGFGLVYSELGDYTKALEYFQQSLDIAQQLNDRQMVANLFSNIGNLFFYFDMNQSLLYYQKAVKILEEIGDKQNLGTTLCNIAMVNMNIPDYPKALAYLNKALNIYQNTNDKFGLGMTVYNIGLTYHYMQDYLLAMDNYQKALKHSEASGSDINIYKSVDGIAWVYVDMPDSVAVKMGIDPQTRYLKALEYGNRSSTLATKIGGLNFRSMAWRLLSAIYEGQRKYDKAFVAYKNYVVLEDSLNNQENNKQITRKEMQYQFDKKQLADSLVNADEHKLAALTLQKQKSYTYAGFAGAAMLLLLSFFIFKNYSTQKKSNKLLSVEKQKSETLLLNILPAEVAEELKETGSAAAKHFDDVTVLFTDFVNFTLLAEKLSPQQLVDELHTCFKAFDDIISKYGIEKIKTIGDAYLAVAGLPIANPNHAANIMAAAVEIKDFMLARRKKLGSDTFEIRIGIHSGSVVAGIVGVKKFAYDIWGDTVNTAARMEQNSEAGKINISETTYDLLNLSDTSKVSDKYAFTYRGEIEAKNKGAMKMYFASPVVAFQQPKL